MNSPSGDGTRVRVARRADVPEGGAVRIIVADHEIALWRVQGVLHAISNTCPHQHIAALHSGSLEGECVTCPMHGWTFSLRTGQAVRGSGRVRVYPVHEEEDWVAISLEDAI